MDMFDLDGMDITDFDNPVVTVRPSMVSRLRLHPHQVRRTCSQPRPPWLMR
jgi:hypothetical protein